MPNSASLWAILILIIYLLVIVGILALQAYLSKQPSKWPGLVLPLLSLLLAMYVAFLQVPASVTVTVSTQTTTSEGVKTEATKEEVVGADDTQLDIAPVISTFLVYNIPTVVLLGIYFGNRERLKYKKELSKMKSKDLE